jgi:hypothetical protein
MPSQYALLVGCEDDVVAIPMILLVSRTGVWTPTLTTRKIPAGVTISLFEKYAVLLYLPRLAETSIQAAIPPVSRDGTAKHGWEHLVGWL